MVIPSRPENLLKKYPVKGVFPGGIQNFSFFFNSYLSNQWRTASEDWWLSFSITEKSGWVFVYELSGCGFESHCSPLLYKVFEKQLYPGVSWSFLLFKQYRCIWEIEYKYHLQTLFCVFLSCHICMSRMQRSTKKG